MVGALTASTRRSRWHAGTSAAGSTKLSCGERQEADEFLSDDVVALAGALLEAGPVEHRDASAAIIDQSAALQFSRRLGDTFAAHPEHVRDELLRHGQLVRRQAI